jgi:hypothetical protein
MSGYGFYDEEDVGQGLITGSGYKRGKGFVTGGLLRKGKGLYAGAGRGRGLFAGAGARPLRKFVVEMQTNEKGKKYPKRLGYTLEYAVKKEYNRKLASTNPWLRLVREDAKLKELRKQIKDRMQELAREYRASLPESKQKESEEKAKARKASEAKRNLMVSSIIQNFKEKFPDVTDGVNYAFDNGLLPNRAAYKMFMKVVYGLTDEDIAKLELPKRFPKKHKYMTSGEMEFQKVREPVSKTELKEAIKEAVDEAVEESAQDVDEKTKKEIKKAVKEGASEAINEVTKAKPNVTTRSRSKKIN